MQPGTISALGEAGITPEFVSVDGDEFGYWHAIRDRWDTGGDLLVIEQDIAVHGDVLPQLESCPGDWCVFPYPIFNSGQRLTQGLGCARFSAALQRRVPAAEFEADGRLRNGHETGIPWNFLDIIIAGRLKLGHGLVPHVHEPDVTHLHDYGGIPATGAEAGVDRPAASPYDRELPVMFGPAEAFTKPAVQVYGVAPTPVASLEDAARLANTLRDRYVGGDGLPLEVPAQLDTSRKPAMRFTTDKVSHGYLPAYLRIAAEAGPSARVCEVGVWSGDSLNLWQALFPGGIIAGVDSDPTASWPAETVPVVCSQDDPGLPGRLAGISPGGWDLIVDDASHDGYLSAETFRLLWPLVAPGGWYVLEDWYVGLGIPPWGDTYGESMLRLAESFLRRLDSRDSEVETVTYQYGMAIVRKRAG